MKKWQKNSSVPIGQDIMQITSDQVDTGTQYWVNSHKIDTSDCVPFSYQTIATIANNTTATIITPLSIGSVIAFAKVASTESKGSMMAWSTGWCIYVIHWTPPAADTVVSDTKLISLWVGTVTSVINGKSLTIANSWVWGTITVILTFFA